MPEATPKTAATAPATPRPAAPSPELAAILAEPPVETVLHRRSNVKPPSSPEPEGDPEPTPATDAPPATEGAPAPGPKTEPATDLPETVKLKVEGQEVEVNLKETFPEFVDTWDKLTEAQKMSLVRNYQRDRASQKRFEESAVTRKHLQKLIATLKEDPMSVLANPALGHDTRKVVEEWLVQQIEFENMDPKDKEIYELKKQRKKDEAEKAASKAEADQKVMDELTLKHTVNYQKDIIGAIEKSGLPKSAETVARIAYYLHQGLRRNVRLKAEDVTDLVREDYEATIKRLFTQADTETLLKILGEDGAEKIRQHYLKKPKSAGETPPTQPPAKTATPHKKKELTREEFRELVRKRVEGSS